MSEKIYEVPAEWKSRAYLDDAKYQEMYARSINDPDGFWAEQAKRLHWYKAPTKIKNITFGPGDVSIKWFEDGVTNVAYNCIDRHLAKRANQTAIIWEGDDPKDDKKVTYQELHDEVCRMANILRNRNVEKGDRVTIYMPMIPEAAYAMLACARIGAIHSVVFGGFSPDSLAGRIEDCASKVVITADEGLRGGRKVPLKANVDAAIAKVGGVDHVIVVKRTGAQGRDGSGARRLLPRRRRGRDRRMPVRAHERRGPAVHPLYVGLDRKTERRAAHHRGLQSVRRDDASIRVRLSRRRHLLVHRRRRLGHGPLVHSLRPALERRDHADVRGHPELSVELPLLGGDRQAQGQHLLHRADRDPRADAGGRGAGEEDLAQVAAPARQRRRADQSGSLGVVLPRGRRQPLPDRRYLVADRDRRHSDHAAARRDAAQARLGDAAVLRRACRRLVDADGKVLEGAAAGNLCIADSWPGQMRTVYGDHQRFIETYFSAYKGKYFTGDGCRRDADGYYWITGRVDDVINVSGHRMGTAEVESALVAHEKVSEAAVVGYPHDIKGQGIYAYVTLMAGEQPSEALRKELVGWVRKEIGPIAAPDLIQFAPGLPKTRSGKIMRRILRKIAEDEFGNLGDTSTLADPAVVDDLVNNRQNKRSKSA